MGARATTMSAGGGAARRRFGSACALEPPEVASNHRGLRHLYTYGVSYDFRNVNGAPLALPRARQAARADRSGRAAAGQLEYTLPLRLAEPVRSSPV